MLKRENWFDLAEYSSIGGVFLGLVGTAITQNIVYSLTPLAFSFFFNTVKIQKCQKQSELSLIQSQKINEIYQDLITFSEEYKYHKLEIEELIKEAQSQKKELSQTIDKSIDSTQNKYIHNQLSFLESSNLGLKQEMQLKLQTIDNRIKDIENFKSEFDHAHQSSIGSSSTLTGLTQYYSLQGLTQKLINEIKTSNDIKYFQKMERNKFLTEDNLKYIQKVAKHSQYLSEVVTTYHKDHGCSYQEALQLSAELNQLAMEISMIRSAYDLRIMYKVVALYTYQISRFQHRKSKYRWNHSMREKMLNVLNDCLSKI